MKVHSVGEINLNMSDCLTLNSREVYDYYKANRKKSVIWLKNYPLFSRTVGAMFMEIKDMLLEAEGGVYLEDLGYFAVMMNPKKTSKQLAYCSSKKDDFKYIKKTHKLVPYFFGDIGNKNFKDWSMSSTFTKYIVEGINKSKINYRLYFSALSQLYKANKITKFSKHKDANNKRNNSGD